MCEEEESSHPRRSTSSRNVFEGRKETEIDRKDFTMRQI